MTITINIDTVQGSVEDRIRLAAAYMLQLSTHLAEQQHLVQKIKKPFLSLEIKIEP